MLILQITKVRSNEVLYEQRWRERQVVSDMERMAPVKPVAVKREDELDGLRTGAGSWLGVERVNSNFPP